MSRDLIEVVGVDRLSRIIASNNPLRGQIIGYVAEDFAREYLEATLNITSVVKIPTSRKRKGDFVIVYRGVHFIVEVKSVECTGIKFQSDGSWYGNARIEHLRKHDVTLNDGSVYKTDHVLKKQIHLLIVCNFNATGQWNFVSALPRDLPSPNIKDVSSTITNQFIKKHVKINSSGTSGFYNDVTIPLERLYLENQLAQNFNVPKTQIQRTLDVLPSGQPSGISEIRWSPFLLEIQQSWSTGIHISQTISEGALPGSYGETTTVPEHQAPSICGSYLFNGIDPHRSEQTRLRIPPECFRDPKLIST
jgi:hypothetical protein